MKKHLKKLGALMLALLLILGAAPLAAFATDYIPIELDAETMVSLEAGDENGITFKFVPKEDGLYDFYSSEYSLDPAAIVYDEEGNQLAYDDDSGKDNNFYICTYMESGKTYLLNAYFLNYDTAGTMTVKVTHGVEATGITILQGDSYADRIGGDLHIEYKLEPENASPQQVIWSTSDDTIAEVNNYGYVYLYKPGKTTVTAKLANGLEDTIEITALEALSIEPDTEYEASHETYNTSTFTFTAPESGYYAFSAYDAVDRVWGSISDSNMNSFASSFGGEKNFRIEAYLSEGETYYFISGYDHRECKSSYKVKVTALVNATAMTLNYTEYTGTAGSGIKLIPVFVPENAITESVFWSSSHEGIASVDSDGIVTMNSVGTATITAESATGLKAECVVTVEDAPEISLCTKTDASISVEGTVYIMRFIPETDGTYIFYSKADQDTYGSIYDGESKELLASDDDSGNNSQFQIILEMTAGNTYLLEASFYDNTRVGNIPIIVSLLDENGNIIHNIKEDDTCGCGYVKHDHVCTNWEYDTEYHYGYCNICEEWIEEKHTIASEKMCICGYIEHEHKVTKLYKEELYHYGYCDICELYIEEDHIYGDDGICKCGYFIHEHDNDGIDYDVVDHWKCCSICGINMTYEFESHDYVDGYCTVCDKAQLHGVYFADILLEEGNYLDLSGNITKTKPDGGYAHLSNGILTLSDFHINKCSEYLEKNITLYSESDLKLVLKGKNSISSPNGDAIYFAAANLTIEGDGLLYVSADGDYDAIDVDGGNLTVNGGTFYINGTDHGIEVYGDLEINDGIFVIVAGDDGMDINGDLTINGGSFNIDAEDNGIDGYYDVTLNGGSFYIYTHDDNGIDADDGSITINNCHIEINSNDYCMDIANSVEIKGGSFILSTRNYETVIGSYEGINIAPSLGSFAASMDDYGYFRLCYEDGTYVTDITMTDNDSVIPIEYDSVQFYPQILDYTGLTLEFPEISVQNGDGIALVEGEDYTVTWHTDVIRNSGVYLVSINGIGDYSASIPFKITVCEHEVRSGICDKCGKEDLVSILINTNEYYVAAGERLSLKADRFICDGHLGYAFMYWSIISEDCGLELDETEPNNYIIPSGDVAVYAEYYLVADINTDGKVNARDKAVITQIIKGSVDASDIADINMDGKVNARDKAAITNIIGGKYDYAPYIAG